MATPHHALALQAEQALPAPRVPLASAAHAHAQPSYAALESLLRERKLDRTLTSAIPVSPGADRLAPFGLPALDAHLNGGVPRGHVSELIGPVSSGRTSLAWTWLGAATARGEAAALIDTFDRFDPASGHACGIELSRLLWVRGQAVTRTAGAIDPAWLPGARAVEGPGTLLERTIDRALKALNLVLQSGVCTAVVLDFADVPLAGIRRVPHSTWLRLQRVVEGTDIACLLLGPAALARSAGGVTIDTVASSSSASSSASSSSSSSSASTHAGAGAARWAGAHDRSRRLAGLQLDARVSSPRRTVQGTAALTTRMVNAHWAMADAFA